MNFELTFQLQHLEVIPKKIIDILTEIRYMIVLKI